MTQKEREAIDKMLYISNKIDYKNKEKKEKDEKKKIKEREKRIKKNKKKTKKMNQFDYDTETVLEMTSRNNKKIKEKNNKIPNKKQRKLEKRKKIIKQVIKWTSVLLLIAGGIIFALVSPIFNINKIEVVNNSQISRETIISLSDLGIGQNIFKFNKRTVEENIKTNAYIENVKIERIIPNEIKINIEERQKDYNVEFLNGYAYINKQGYILEISENKLDAPVIQGISTQSEQIKPGNRLEESDLEKLNEVIQIINICKNYELDTKITSIDITDKTEYTLYIDEEKKTIYLGDTTNLNNKMLYVQAIIQENQGKEGNIYVNGDMNNKFKARFREKVW